MNESESFPYLCLTFVKREQWSKIVWYCALHCHHVTMLVVWQRYQGDIDGTTGILNYLLNIPCYQWQASVVCFNGRVTHLRGIPKQVTHRSAASSYWACCRFVVLSVCTEIFWPSTGRLCCELLQHRCCVWNVQVIWHKTYRNWNIFTMNDTVFLNQKCTSA